MQAKEDNAIKDNVENTIMVKPEEITSSDKIQQIFDDAQDLGVIQPEV